MPDLGSGIAVRHAYLAAAFGCKVTGVDLRPGFIDAAIYLTERCGLADRVTFQARDALHFPFEDAAFDAVLLQHAAMNIKDRSALYAEVRRILTPSGRIATHDLVLRDGDVVYLAPSARDASTSFLFSEADIRAALEQTGFQAALWRDDPQGWARLEHCRASLETSGQIHDRTLSLYVHSRNRAGPACARTVAVRSSHPALRVRWRNSAVALLVSRVSLYDVEHRGGI